MASISTVSSNSAVLLAINRDNIRSSPAKLSLLEYCTERKETLINGYNKLRPILNVYGLDEINTLGIHLVFCIQTLEFIIQTAQQNE